MCVITSFDVCKAGSKIMQTLNTFEIRNAIRYHLRICARIFSARKRKKNKNIQPLSKKKNNIRIKKLGVNLVDDYPKIECLGGNLISYTRTY